MSDNRKLFNYDGKDYELSVVSYQTDPAVMGVVLFDSVDHEPYGTISVNLGSDIGNGSIMQLNSTFLDVNNVPGIEEAVVEQGLAKPYTRFGSPVRAQSGFVQYPLYEFDAEELKKYDPEGYDTYKETWSKAVAEYQAFLSKAQNAELENDDDAQWQTLYPDDEDMLTEEIEDYQREIEEIENDEDMDEGEKSSHIGEIETEIEKLKMFRGDYYMDGNTDDKEDVVKSEQSQESSENVSDVSFERITDKRGTERIKTEVDGKTVAFAAHYGNHEFSDEEITKMLQGEEITIPDFQTKSGKVMDITGKLDTGKYMGREYFGFQRTDVQKERSLPTVAESVEAQSETQFE